MAFNSTFVEVLNHELAAADNPPDLQAALARSHRGPLRAAAGHSVEL
jgi:hypothetical protein